MKNKGTMTPAEIQQMINKFIHGGVLMTDIQIIKQTAAQEYMQNPDTVEKRKQVAATRRIPRETYETIYKLSFGPTRGGKLYKQISKQLGVNLATVQNIASGKVLYTDKEQYEKDVAQWKLKNVNQNLKGKKQRTKDNCLTEEERNARRLESHKRYRDKVRKLASKR